MDESLRVAAERAMFVQKDAPTDTAKRIAAYAEYCRSHDVPLSLQGWWWEAVCGSGHWSVALSMAGGSRVAGAMPYCLSRHRGLRLSRLPPFVSYAGPWLCYPDDRDFRLSSRYSFEQRVMADLIGQLPKPLFFSQTLHPAVTNVLPFHAAGFRHSTRYTYLLEHIDCAEAVYREFKNPLRRKLQKAEQATRVRRDDEAAALVLHLNELSLQRKHLRPPERAAAFGRLHQALTQRRQCAVWIAEDRISGTPHAGLYLAFDGHWATALVAGFDPAHGQHCGLYGLYREAIAFCAERQLTLDFDGGMDAGVGAVFRAFGGRMTPFFEVWRSSHWLADVVYALRK